ncbi:DUF4314 domain-containing protein [Plantactinospora sp. WMMB334]|uniref:DUF4314 domain-containing protein n=1 Tax=Plantactinospora sp. WMMB334 TaxID=3404119 RepID=UPI003B934FFA
MSVYLSGPRVVLVHTSDPHTRLRPGALGTVRSHDQQSNTVAIAWDDGSTLAMLLNDGDRITLAPGSQAVTADAPDDERPASAGSPAQDSGAPASPVADSDAVTYVIELPSCDIHRTLSGTVVPAGYDGATRFGPWAFMCDGCFLAFGLGLGVGRGQRLILGRRPDSGAAADSSGPD